MEITINKAILIKISDKETYIEWEGNLGYGVISILHEGNGYYKIDSEALSLETVIKIIQKVEL